MATLLPYHLDFTQALRLSDRGLTLEETALWIPADTLFSAIVDACARYGEDATGFARPFAEGAPPFLLTSAFPRVGQLRFYPAPVDLTVILDAALSPTDAKRAGTVRYLSEALFQRALSGEKLDAFWDARSNGRFLQQGALWLTADEVPLLPAGVRLLDTPARRERPPDALRELAIWATERAPHVAVDRVQSATDIYFVGRTHFRPECGLWFGVQDLQPGGPAQEGARLLPRLLQLLQDEGLGGKRSSGNGGFALEPQPPFTLPDAATGKPAWLLSRVSPRADELPQLLHGERTSYRVTSVAGWMRPPSGASMRRKRLALLAEGSWVVPSGPLIGRVVDVRPAEWVSHPVYRYGYGLAAGLA